VPRNSTICGDRPGNDTGVRGTWPICTPQRHRADQIHGPEADVA
jgi:hypothetical protein